MRPVAEGAGWEGKCPRRAWLCREDPDSPAPRAAAAVRWSSCGRAPAGCPGPGRVEMPGGLQHSQHPPHLLSGTRPPFYPGSEEAALSPAAVSSAGTLPIRSFHRLRGPGESKPPQEWSSGDHETGGWMPARGARREGALRPASGGHARRTPDGWWGWSGSGVATPAWRTGLQARGPDRSALGGDPSP